MFGGDNRGGMGENGKRRAKVVEQRVLILDRYSTIVKDKNLSTSASRNK